MHSKDRNLVEADALSRRSQLKERSHVYARRDVAAYGLVAFDDDVLDGLRPVGKGSTDALDCVSDPTVSLQIAEPRSGWEVADKVRRVKIRDFREFARIPQVMQPLD